MSSASATQTNNTPLVSIIVPACNVARFIAVALESALSQTYRKFEIIVVDDGSTDETAQVLEPFLDVITYRYQTNLGLAAARNTALNLARGEYIAFLDADDLFLPEKLEKQVAFLEAHLAVGLVACGWTYISEDGRILGVDEPWLDTPELNLHELLHICPFMPLAVLVRREWLSQVGFFDEDLPKAEDWDIWLRLAKAGCYMEWLPENLCLYRLRDKSLSADPVTLYDGSRKVLDKYFAELAAGDPLHAERQSLFSVSFLRSMCRKYASGQVDAAKRDLWQAIELDPTLLSDNGSKILGYLVAQANSRYVADADQYLDRVYDNLPESLIGILPSRSAARAMVRQKHFYVASAQNKRGEATRALIGAVRLNPSWLKDRGTISLWIKTLLGPKRDDERRTPGRDVV